MKRNRFAKITCAAACCAALLFATFFNSPTATGQRQNSFDVEVSRAFSRYDVIELEPMAVLSQVRSTGRLTIPTSEGTFEIDLVPHDMRAENYRAVAVLEGGALREIPRDVTRTYKGTVRGLEGAQARFTIDERLVEGLIITRDRKFFIEPASRYSSDASSSEHLFYSESDIVGGNAAVCGVTMAHRVELEVSRMMSSAEVDEQPLPPLSPMREAEIATDADFEYFQALGSEAAAKNEILSIMNQVDGVYEAEIGLSFKVIYQRVFTTAADPYDGVDLSTLLEQVRQQWKTAPPAGTETRDLVHMWTGRDLNGLQTGLAYSNANGINGVVCRFLEVSVGVSERLIGVPQKYVVTAHEIGHNFSATHPEDSGRAECVLTIMSGVAQSNTVFTFCQFSRDEITSYITAHGNCLANAPAQSATFQFTQGAQNVTEDAVRVTFTVSRSSGDGAAMVQYETVNQTANDRSDYTTALGTLRFAQGETQKTFTVLITDDVYGVNTKPSTDTTSEAALETFQVVLTNPTNGNVGTPSASTVTIADNDVTDKANPVRWDANFNASFFVRQHYADFLNREPDAGGLSFWTNQINECGADTACAEVRRINVSGAFFLSPEFQETGFYVIRVFRVGFGGRSESQTLRIAYRPFIRDARQVGEGFIDGQSGSGQVLENNKAAYAQQVVSDPAFVANFPTNLSAAQYVDALFAKAGVTPTTNERQAAINAFGGGGVAGRAAALKSVADAESVRNAEFRQAFVLMQYFGYLRRDPDQDGYNFWLGKLNQFNGNYITAEMVKAFITSGEYYARFGP